jgi:hypothetical protein
MSEQVVVDAVKAVMAATFADGPLGDRVTLVYPGAETDLTPPGIDPVTKKHKPFIAVFFPPQGLNSLEIGAPQNVRWREDGIFFCWIMLPIVSESDLGRAIARRISRAFLGTEQSGVVFESSRAGSLVDQWDTNWWRISLGLNYSFDFLLSA